MRTGCADAAAQICADANWKNCLASQIVGSRVRFSFSPDSLGSLDEFDAPFELNNLTGEHKADLPIDMLGYKLSAL